MKPTTSSHEEEEGEGEEEEEGEGGGQGIQPPSQQVGGSHEDAYEVPAPHHCSPASTREEPDQLLGQPVGEWEREGEGEREGQGRRR